MASRYVKVTKTSFRTLKEAKADPLEGDILKVAGYNDKCPKGSDHAHASYDGATFCRSCGQYLTVRIDVRL